MRKYKQMIAIRLERTVNQCDDDYHNVLSNPELRQKVESHPYVRKEYENKIHERWVEKKTAEFMGSIEQFFNVFS